MILGSARNAPNGPSILHSNPENLHPWGCSVPVSWLFGRWSVYRNGALSNSSLSSGTWKNHRVPSQGCREDVEELRFVFQPKTLWQPMRYGSARCHDEGSTKRRFCTNFSHHQFLCDNFMNHSFHESQFLCDHSCSQPSVTVQYRHHCIHILLHFLWREASWSLFIFHTLASILESFVPSVDLCRREDSLSISFPQHFEGLWCAVTHFHTKF